MRGTTSGCPSLTTICARPRTRALPRGFFEVFEDRHRLEQRRTAVDDERGHHALRVDRLVFLGVLLSLQQIDRDLFDLYAFERESGAHAVSGQRPPESVEFHGHRLLPPQGFGGITGTRT